MSENKNIELEGMDEKLLQEFSKRVKRGDSSAGLDLAQFYWGQLPSNEVSVHIAVMEALITQSANLGSEEAQEYLTEMWPKMKKALEKRLVRKGFEDNWSISSN